MSSTMLLLAGRLNNDLARGTVTSTSANSLFPLTRLYDGKPMQEFRFNAAGADDSITLDGDILLGAGAFESGIASSWTGSGGTWAVDTGTVHSGTNSGKLSHSGATSRIYPMSCRSGETLNGAYAIRGDGTASAKIYIYNTRTGKYWNGSSWTSTRTALDSQTTASFKTGTFAATVEGYSTARAPIVTVNLEFELSASGAAYFDSTYIWPSWDFVSVHGHNLGPVTCQIRSSTDNFSGSDTLEATATIAAPTFWNRLSAVSARRYRRVKFVGTNHEAIRLGEMVTGQAYAATRTFQWGWELVEIHSDVAMQMPDAGLHVVNATEYPRRAFACRFDRSETEHDEAEREFFGRSQGRANPLVVVPDNNRSEALFGRLGATWAATRVFTNIYDQGDFQLTEEPFPRAVA